MTPLRTLLLATTATLARLAAPAQAIVVFDPSNYTENVLQAARALEQINNQIKSLQNEVQMLQDMAKHLEKLDFTSLPALESAGNVLRPSTSLKLSLRLPPSLDAATALDELSELLTRDPPYGATVTFKPEEPGQGWNAPPLASWLEQSIERASQTYFQREACYMGEGGSIPFMGMLGRKFPKAQFMITGVLGPQSNAHGPNEFLHVPMAKRLTACVASVLADHAAT